MNKVYKPKVSFSDSSTKAPPSLPPPSLIKNGTRAGTGGGGGGSVGGGGREVRPRSRSVYTTSSYLSDDLGGATGISGGGGGGGSGGGGVTPREHLGGKCGGAAASAADGYVQWSPYIPKPIVVKNYFPDDLNVGSETWTDQGYMGGTTITPHGVISLRLHDRIRVDISLDRAVRIVNMKNYIVLALSAGGSSSALIHPNGRVLQYGSRVEILAHDNQGNNKYAKMWYKGVSFTSDQCALVYLVDSAGTRTTTDTFTDLTGDITLDVFYNRQNGDPDFSCVTPGTHLINEAVNVLRSANYWLSEDRTDNWIINNVRISQTADGLVRVGRNSNKFSLRTSPTNGSASVSSPYLHCTGSMGQTRHLFVRRGERRMHYDGTTFIVRNAGHSAGFDERHQLKVY